MGCVGLEYQQLTLTSLSAIHDEVFEAGPHRNLPETTTVAPAKIFCELGHKPLLFRTLCGALLHTGRLEMNHPMIGNREMAWVGRAFDDGDAVLMIETILAGVVYKAR